MRKQFYLRGSMHPALFMYQNFLFLLLINRIIDLFIWPFDLLIKKKIRKEETESRLTRH
jgi:hypothetical protein